MIDAKSNDEVGDLMKLGNRDRGVWRERERGQSVCCCGVAMDMRNRGRKGLERDLNESN